jgi:sugar/nucleoside kinase (ribokinase family)
VTIVVVGYASVDWTLRLDRLPSPGVTARVQADLGGGTERPGGIGHTVLALAAGLDDEVVPICALGDDSDGRHFVEAMAAAGCPVDGIVASGARSPSTTLFVDPDGATAWVFDPAIEWRGLTDAQCQLVAAADVVVVMIGPAAVTGETLACTRPASALAWIVKNDPAALPPELAAELRRRAHIIFHNAAESSVVDGLPPAPAPIVVCTDGPRPVTVTTQQGRRAYAIPPAETVGNPTGAGDAFAGGYLAAWLRSADEASCVAAGAAAARLRVGAAR